jgi:hypothetical protein
MDVAASEFFSEKDKTYGLNFKEDVRTATSYASICSKACDNKLLGVSENPDEISEQEREIVQ